MFVYKIEITVTFMFILADGHTYTFKDHNIIV